MVVMFLVSVLLITYMQHPSPDFQAQTLTGFLGSLTSNLCPRLHCGLNSPPHKTHLAPFLRLAQFCGKTKPQEPSLSTQEVGPMPHPRPRTQISSLAKVGGAGCGRAASDLKWQVGQVGAGGEVCTCVWGWGWGGWAQH